MDTFLIFFKYTDALGPTTSLVLVNGIYFKGFWKYPFNQRYTFKEPFHVTPSKQLDVDMMHLQEYFPYGKLPELNAEAVALPYKGDRVSMVIILPNKVDGLTGIQSNIGSILNDGKSFVWDLLTRTHEVEVSFPKFKVETNIKNLKQVLQIVS